MNNIIMSVVLNEIYDWMHKLDCMDVYMVENVKDLLTEADSRIKKVEKIIRNRFDGVLNPDNTVPLSTYYVNNNPNTTWLQYLIYNLRHTFGLMSNQDVALLPNTARIAYDELRFDFDNQDMNKIHLFKNMLGLIKKDPQAFTEFVKGQPTFDTLYAVYGKQMEQDDADMRQRMNSKSYTVNENYQIILISSQREAYKYAQYSGVKGGGSLCFATDAGSWMDFSNDEHNTCYVCLRNDWQNIPCEKGEGYPKDDYGLSMIFLFVNEEGKLMNSNVRWNHGDGSYGNVDNMFTEEEISDIIGKSFTDAFKPVDVFTERKGDIQKMLDNGEDLRDVFDYCGQFRDGYAIVKLTNKYNLISKDRRLLSPDLWFDSINHDYAPYDEQSMVYARVLTDKGYNFIRTDGSLLSDMWFEICYPFYDGFTVVRVNRKFNFLNYDGKLLSDEWFDNADGFMNDYGIVQKDDLCNYIDVNGNILSPNVWFTDCNPFMVKYGEVEIYGNDNYEDGEYIVDKNGQIRDIDTKEPVYPKQQ